MTIQITVLGLGQVGVSLGLALGEHKDQVLRVGNDRSSETMRAVSKLEAFDQLTYNLSSAVGKADAVILAVPVDEIRKTLEEFAQDLKPGAVVIDTAPLTLKVMKWAEELLPEGRFFISMTPTLNPIYLEEVKSGAEAAHADLFKNSLMVITSLPEVGENAFRLASDLATMLGSSPYFADPWEVDGLLAAAHILPRLLAAALTNAVSCQAGWTESRKLAGKAFALASAPTLLPDETKLLGQAALHNSENTLRVLGNLAAELESLRQAIETQDEEALSEQLERARQSRLKWWNQRSSGDWSDRKEEPLPSAGDFFGQMLGFRKKKKN